MTSNKNDGDEAAAPHTRRNLALAMLAAASGSHAEFLETVVRALYQRALTETHLRDSQRAITLNQ